MRLLVGTFSVSLLVAFGCAKDAPVQEVDQSQSEPAASRPLTPASVDLSFLSAQVIGIIRVDVGAIGDPGVWGELGRQMRIVFTAVPGCTPGLLDATRVVLVGFPRSDLPGEMYEKLQVQVTGAFQKPTVLRCAQGFASGLGLVVSELDDGFRISQASGEEITTLSWTRDGFVVGPSDQHGKETGPGPVLQRLLQNLDTASPVWVVVDPSPTDPDGFDEAWIEVRTEEGVRIRGGFLAQSEEVAETGPVEFLGGIVKGARRYGMSLELEGLRERFGFRREGKWAHFDARWTAAEVAAFANELTRVQQGATGPDATAP